MRDQHDDKTCRCTGETEPEIAAGFRFEQSPATASLRPERIQDRLTAPGTSAATTGLRPERIQLNGPLAQFLTDAGNWRFLACGEAAAGEALVGFFEAPDLRQVKALMTLAQEVAPCHGVEVRLEVSPRSLTVTVAGGVSDLTAEDLSYAGLIQAVLPEQLRLRTV